MYDNNDHSNVSSSSHPAEREIGPSVGIMELGSVP